MRYGTYYFILFFIISSTTFSSAIVINEFVVDPQIDWDGSGSATSSDEWIELFNPSNQTIDITNWTIVMNDSLTTNASIEILSEVLVPHSYSVILNPEGSMSMNGQIFLYDSFGVLVDSVSYGDWDDGNISDNAPEGGAEGSSDECLARIPNGEDSGIDLYDFMKNECTYQRENKELLSQEQGLNVEIAGLIVFEILPRWLEFGLLVPGSVDSPALNGPITFDATGSTTDVYVEIVDVLGYPFDSGLKIDGGSPIGMIWNLLTSSQIDTAIPTLDIPDDASAGNNQGTIVYLVTGPTP